MNVGDRVQNDGKIGTIVERLEDDLWLVVWDYAPAVPFAYKEAELERVEE